MYCHDLELTNMLEDSPTGPKSMRNHSSHRNSRLMGQISKAMDRSNDSVLHRVRPHQGTERINSHSREPPKGPRSAQARAQRPPMGRGPGMMQNGAPGGALMNMTPQQQMQLFAMYEEQARMMSQILSPHQQQGFMGTGMPMPMMNGGFGPVYPQPPPQQHGRSLFERVEAPPQRQNVGFNKRNHQHQNSGGRLQPQHQQDVNMDTDAHEVPTSHTQPPATSSGTMEGVETPAETPADAVCKFNLACTKTDCRFGHQSPAAPPGTAIDLSDSCPFGAACKNRKCVARHPSPAVKITHQSEMDCKFFPNCTNAACPFKHPTMPLCRNGADCTREGCRFTHVKTICKYNPCLNPVCAFKHAEGQKRGGFEDKVWTAGSGGRQHVSERKFVDENGEEELIVPGSSKAESATSLELTA
jgi:nuclear polyadenylated RNA-binding protein NAB2